MDEQQSKMISAGGTDRVGEVAGKEDGHVCSAREMCFD
tara:strand:+ start:1562 stop:1675 length:114 start_codon:yes stop_codon:yes gene_type:complete